MCSISRLGGVQNLNKAGFNAYIAGGAIRDMLLKRRVTDFDISTDALPHEIMGVFRDALEYGDFGTVMVFGDGYKIDITPFRDDAPGRKPVYKFGGSIYTDLARRDFTFNSMAYDPICREFIDPIGGRKDLDAGIIRCTGSTKRIWEDPLRALRAARFRSQLGFMIEPSTLYAMCSQRSKLKNISKERIRDEFTILVTGRYVFNGLVTLVVTGLMDYIVPEMAEGMGLMHNNKPVDVLEHNMLACKYIKIPQLRIIALLHDVANREQPLTANQGWSFAIITWNQHCLQKNFR